MTEDPRTILEEAATVKETAAQAASVSALTAFRDCRVLEQFPALGAEADVFLVERGGESMILKLYRLGMEPSEEVLRQVTSFSARFPEHIVAIREFGHDGQTRRRYELQEYAREGSLRDLMSAGGAAGPEAATQILREISAALSVLHEHKILHLDLKPSNILLRSREPLNLIFTDFGISSVIDPELSRKLTTIKGTPHYWAPESISGVVGTEADYWALGMIVLEILLGRHPFAGVDNKIIMYTLATRGVDVPEGIDAEFVPLVQGLLTREPHLRWGRDQVQRWLAGERKIPLFYHRGETAAAAKDAVFHFRGRGFKTTKELAAFVVSDAAAWKDLWNRIEGGQLTQWLRDNGESDTADKVQKILECCKRDPDMAVLRLVYDFDGTLPFALYGKLISLNNLRLCVRNFLAGAGDEHERAIVDDLVKGSLFRGYQEYLLCARREPDLLFVVLETISRAVTVSDFVYDFRDEVLNIASFLEAVHDPAPYLLPEGWRDSLESHVATNAAYFHFWITRDQYARLQNSHCLPGDITSAITEAASSGDAQRLFRLLKLLRERLDEKLLFTREEIEGLAAEFILPAGTAQAIGGGSFEAAIQAARTVRELAAQGLLLRRAGLAEYLAASATAFPYAVQGQRLLDPRSKGEVPEEEYRRLARYRKLAVPVLLLPRLKAVLKAFNAAEDRFEGVDKAPLYRYLDALDSMNVVFDNSDQTIITELWHLLSAKKVPVRELLGIEDPAARDVRLGHLLEHYLKRNFDGATQEREWAMKGAVLGLVLGFASWLPLLWQKGSYAMAIVILSAALAAARQSPATLLACVALTLGLVSLGKVSFLRPLSIGDGSLMVALLLMALFGYGFGLLGAHLGRSRPARYSLGDRIYRRHQARIDDVLAAT